jgi:hypothetical protein
MMTTNSNTTYLADQLLLGTDGIVIAGLLNMAIDLLKH